jgi:uncharacterized protein YqiB (DUF1249 family)
MSHLKKRYIVNFPGHMADCELNYRRLRKLMPGWCGIPASEEELLARDASTGCWNYILGNLHGNHSNGEMGFTIEVTERAKYTTTVHIIVYSRLQSQISWVKNHSPGKTVTPLSLREGKITVADKALQAKMSPNGSKAYSLDVRLYHDAAVAEVIAWQGHRRFQARHEYPNRKMYQRDEKAQLNKFLGELLEFCLTQGRVMQEIVTTV